MSAIKIDGMTCGACVKTIESALSGFVDPKDCARDLDMGIAHFNDTIDMNEVLSRINNSGYSASLIDSSKQIEIPKDKEQSAFDLVPLYIILSYIFLGSLGLNAASFTMNKFMTDYMGLFYIMFSLIIFFILYLEVN